MNNAPLVTALIPTYNRAAYVTKAIDSALAQTWPSVEVLVINDGSPDNTDEVLAAYGDKIRVVNQANAGLSRARNAGIEQAKGEFIALLDDDDIWLPQRLSIQMPHMLANPDVGLIGGAARLIDSDGEPVGTHTPRTGEPIEVRPKALFTANRISCPTALVRRSALFEAGLFDPDITYAEDYAMWLKISERHRILTCREQVALYRVWSNNMTHANNADKARWISSHILVRERALQASERLRKLPAYTIEKHLLWYFRSRECMARDADDTPLAQDLARRRMDVQALCGISPVSASAQRALHWAARRLGIK